MEGQRLPDLRQGRLLTGFAAVSLFVVALAGAVAYAQEGDGNGNGGVVVLPDDDGVGAGVGTPGDETSGGSSGGSGRTCWFKLDVDSEGNPKWPFVDVTTGKIAYAWFFLYCDGTLVDVAPYLLAVDGSGVRPAGRTLAEQAYQFLPLPAPAVRFNPSRAITRLATWWWVDPSSWGTRTVTVGVTGLSATVTAVPVSVRWNAGDGSTALTCAGPGVPYNPTRPAGAHRTDCAHVYRHDSRNEPGGAYAGSATTRWQVTWRASDGSSGTLPVLERTTAFDVPVGQVRTVVTSAN